MIRFFIIQLLLFITITAFSNDNNYQGHFWTLTRVYGAIKYYNNEKDDSYLDKEAITFFPKLENAEYINEHFNADLIDLFPEDQRILSSGAELINPFDQFKGTDYKRTVDFSWIDKDKVLSEQNKKLLWQLIYTHKKVKNSNIKKKQIFIHEENKLPESLSGAGRYMLGLVKYWNVIEYFFPYKPLMDEDWAKVFYEKILEFSSIKTDEDYLTVLKKLSAKLNDSHVDVEDEKVNDVNVYKLPFSIVVAENQMVIKNINDSLSNIYNIKTGDVIDEIDGKNYNDFWQEYSELYAYSTPQGGKDFFKTYLFLRFNYYDSTIIAKVKRNQEERIIIFQTIRLQDFIRLRVKQNPTGNFRSISEQIGYIEYPEMGYFELGKAFRKLKNKGYLILDFRGHTYGLIHWRLLNFVGNKKVPFAKYYQPNHAYPGVFSNPKEVKHNILPKFRSSYKGKIVVLINEENLSAMESVLMAIQLRKPNATFIGSTTQGCDGQKNLVILPGNRKIWFTGQGDWQYPDGTQFQRIGIQPDIYVEPTVESIRIGEDIVLNRATEHIESLIKNK